MPATRTRVTEYVLGELDTRGIDVDLDDGVAAALGRSELVTVHHEFSGAWLSPPRAGWAWCVWATCRCGWCPRTGSGSAGCCSCSATLQTPTWARTRSRPATSKACCRPSRRRSPGTRSGRWRPGPGAATAGRRTTSGRCTAGSGSRTRCTGTRASGCRWRCTTTTSRWTSRGTGCLRTAVRRMRHVPGVAEDVRRTLARLDRQLDAVGLLPLGARLPRVPSEATGRGWERYRPALALAELVLRARRGRIGRWRPPGRGVLGGHGQGLRGLRDRGGNRGPAWPAGVDEAAVSRVVRRTGGAGRGGVATDPAAARCRAPGRRSSGVDRGRQVQARRHPRGISGGRPLPGVLLLHRAPCSGCVVAGWSTPGHVPRAPCWRPTGCGTRPSTSCSGRWT